MYQFSKRGAQFTSLSTTNITKKVNIFKEVLQKQKDVNAVRATGTFQSTFALVCSRFVTFDLFQCFFFIFVTLVRKSDPSGQKVGLIILLLLAVLRMVRKLHL